jgi:DNA-binding NtrC family response regulator
LSVRVDPRIHDSVEGHLEAIAVQHLNWYGLLGEQLDPPVDGGALRACIRGGEVAVMVVPVETKSSHLDELRRLDPLVQVIAADGDDHLGVVRYALEARRAHIDVLIRAVGGVPAGSPACRHNDELIGGGEAMSGLRNRLRQVAEHDVPSLVHGPTGSPVEATARWLHTSSRRHDAPLVAIDCDSGSETQVLGRLFGYAPGAFPGADRSGVAAVMLARGGTLLLRSLDRATPGVQDRVVELLRDGAWCPVGDRHWRSGDVRIVVSMHQPPVQAVMRGMLSRSVLERFGSHVIRVPSLRDRLEDFEELLSHQIKRSAKRLGRRTPSLPSGLVAVLTEAPWAGNDREFEALCERLVLYGQGVELDPGMVRDWICAATPDATAVDLVCDGQERVLADLERDAILATLQHFRGHRRRAAEALGIGVRTLGLKLRQWKDANIIPESL